MVDVAGLIAAVKRRQCLYDLKLKNNTAKTIVDKEWQGVASEVGTSVRRCKKKWANLRRSYGRFVRNNTSSEASGKRWHLADAIAFIDKNVQCNVIDSKNDGWVTEDQDEEPSVSNTKTRRSSRKKRRSKRNVSIPHIVDEDMIQSSFTLEQVAPPTEEELRAFDESEALLKQETLYKRRRMTSPSPQEPLAPPAYFQQEETLSISQQREVPLPRQSVERQETIPLQAYLQQEEIPTPSQQLQIPSPRQSAEREESIRLLTLLQNEVLPSLPVFLHNEEMPPPLPLSRQEKLRTAIEISQWKNIPISPIPPSPPLPPPPPPPPPPLLLREETPPSQPQRIQTPLSQPQRIQTPLSQPNIEIVSEDNIKQESFECVELPCIQLANEEDPNLTFFRSVLPDMRRLSLARQRRLKREFLEKLYGSLDEIENY